jgi:hypothetical protein
MGIAPFLISSSVILACAQRLMRRICSHCKQPVTYPVKMYQDLNIDPSIFDRFTAYGLPAAVPAAVLLLLVALVLFALVRLIEPRERT